MDNLKEYSLNYQFDFPNVSELKSGDSLASTCPPTDTNHMDITNLTSVTDSNATDNATDVILTNDPENLSNKSPDCKTGVILSPDGFPLEFSFQIVYHNYYREASRFIRKLRISIQLRLHQPTSVPFLPPLLIQPTLVPEDDEDPHRPSWLNKRHVGPDHIAAWRCTLITPDLSAIEVPLHFSGQFRFQLLDEPQRLIDNLPARSKATWPSLPNDMVSAVLRQLPLAERVKARLVCRQWARTLDSDALAWNNVTHLHLQYIRRKDINDYDSGNLNLVESDKAFEALRFLASRTAPIRTLEIDTVISKYGNDYSKHLSECLSEMKISLKALSLNIVSGSANPYLIRLLNAQPGIQRLHLGMQAPLALLSNPSLFQHWHCLRILSLKFFFPDSIPQLNVFTSSRFPSLQGLRLNLWRSDLTDDQISQTLENRLPYLRRLQSADWFSSTAGLAPSNRLSCSCKVFNHIRHLVFGSENLSPSAAAYLLMPLHRWHGHFLSHHHI